MQDHGGAAAETAITSSERRFIHEVLVDWNNDGQFDHPLSDLGGYVDSIDLDRSLSGSAPAEIMLIEGSAAAELTLSLGGEYKSLPLTGVFSPYNQLSPMYGDSMVGAEITYRIGVETPTSTFWYSQFIGNVRTVTPRRADNTVEITALDRVEKLRKPVILPPWAMSDIHVQYGELDSQLCRSSWVIDHCLRHCDVSPSPKRPPFMEELSTSGVVNEGDGPQFWLTGNGSYLPTIGWLDNPSASTFPDDSTAMYADAGPRHPDAPVTAQRPLALAGLGTPIRESGQYVSPPGHQGVVRYWALSRDGINPTATHYFGFTINTTGPNANRYQTVGLHTVLEVMLGRYYAIYIDIQAGQIRTRWERLAAWSHDGSEQLLDQITDSGAWVNLPTGVEHIDVFAEWDLSGTGTRYYLDVNGSNTGWVTVHEYVPQDIHYDQIAGRVTIGQALSLSDVYFSSRRYFDPQIRPGEGFREATYRAELDIGKNRFSNMPSAKPQEAWQTITDVAAAEMGSVFWDEEGVFRFWNQDTILGKQRSVVRSLSLDQASDLVITNSLDSVRNVYTIGTNHKRGAVDNVIFEADDVNQFYVPAGTEKTFRVWADDVMSPLPFLLTKHLSQEGLISPFWHDGVTHGYCCQWLEDNEWYERPELISGVDIHVYFTVDGYLVIRIWNGYEFPVRLASGGNENSQPALRVRGTKIIEDANCYVWSRGTESIRRYGARNLELSGDWYQDTIEGLDLISQLRRRTEVPIPATDGIEIAGDPRLQLGDTLSLYDPSGLGEDIRVQLLGISRRYSRDEGLRDTLTVEMVNPAGTPPTITVDSDKSLTVGESITIGAVFQTFGAPSYAITWTVVSGPDYVGDVSIGESINFVPNAVGEYVIEASIETVYGVSSDTITVSVAAIPDPGNGGRMPLNPGEALWIGRTGGNWYNVGLGKPDDHYDYDWDEILDGFSDPDRFYLNDNGNVEFKVKITEQRTSENTNYPRSELRELNPRGEDGGEVSWDGNSGNHYMKARSRVRRVARMKPEVCFFQIHDARSDLIRVITTNGGDGNEGLRLKVLWTPPDSSSESSEIIKGSYNLDEWVDWYIEVNNGVLSIQLNGSTVIELDGMGSEGCYFKHGAYAQSAVNEKKDTEDGDGNQWFIVETEKGSFETWHTGYPAPTTPDFTGGDDESGRTTRRFYLTNTAAKNPTTRSANYWNDATAASSAGQLSSKPAGSATSRTKSETSDIEQWVLMGQWVSSPATQGGTLYGDWRLTAGWFENNSDADLFPIIGVWVTDGATDELKGNDFIINTAVNNYEIPTSGRASEMWGNAQSGIGTIEIEPGDRLVVEFGYRADNTSETSYGSTLNFGGTKSTDLGSGDTDFTRPAWIDLELEGVVFGSDGGIGGPNPEDGTQAAVVHGWGNPIPEWSDEFNYTGSPDSSKWGIPGTDWPGHNENGRRRPERQVVADGKLVMTGLQNGDTGWMQSEYDSPDGGRWEARIRSFQGAPSAGEPDSTSNGNDYHALLLIWPESNSRSKDGEYDLMELGAPGQNSLESYMHYPDDPEDDETEQEHFEKLNVDMSEWHNVAFEYKRGDDGFVRGFIDGEQWFTHTGGGGPNGRRDIQDMPAGHICIQLDNFDGLDQTPATIEVEWVRVYDPEADGDPGGGGGAPGSVFDLSRWHLTTPADSGDGDAEQINQPELDSYESEFLYLDDDGFMVCFAPIDGETTSEASGSTRSEFREREADYDESAWDPATTGVRQLTITTRGDASSVNPDPPGRKEMSLFQIHGAGSSPIPLMVCAEYHVEVPRIRVFYDGDGIGNPVTGINGDTPVTIRCRVEDALVKLWIVQGQVSDLPSVTSEADYEWAVSSFTDRSEWYFKFGAYNKSKIEEIDSGTTGEAIAKISYLDLIQS